MNSTQLAFRSICSEQIKLYRQTCHDRSDTTELMAVLQTREQNDDNDDDDDDDKKIMIISGMKMSERENGVKERNDKENKKGERGRQEKKGRERRVKRKRGKE